MQNNTFKEILKWIIKIGIVSTLFIQFYIYGGFFFPYIFTKTIVFRITIEIVLAAYLMLIVVAPEYRFKSSKLSKVLFAYIGIMLISSVMGVNFSRSFLGTVERSEGIITILHLAALFVVSAGVLKEKKDWLMLFDIAFFAGLLQAGYALLQKLNVETFLGYRILNAGGRLNGTIGNASFLAGLIVFVIFIGALLYIQKESKNWRIFYSAGILFLAYILYHIQTRGAILGLFGGIILFGILSSLLSGNKNLKRSVAAFIIFIILFGSTVWICREQEWVKKQGTLNKLTSISMTDISTQARLLGWQGAIKGWMETPKTFLFGYGFENYNIPFNKYFNTKIFIDEGSQLWFDRAHNIVLDVALTSGLLGLIIYLTIYAVISSILYKLYKDNKENLYLYLLIFCGLAAYFIQNLFVFDTLPIYILLYLAFAYIVFLNRNRILVQETKTQEKADLSIFGIGIIISIAFAGMYVINIRPVKANIAVNKAFRASHLGNEATNNYEKINTQFDQLLESSGKTREDLNNLKDYWKRKSQELFEESVGYFEEAISYDTYQNREFREKYIEAVLTSYRAKQLSQEKVVEYFDRINVETQKNVNEYKEDVQEYLYAMTAYNITIMKDNPEKLNILLDLGAKAIELSPTRPQIYYEIGKAYLEQRRISEAIANLKKGVELNPDNLESRWNLLVAYIQADLDKEADTELATMISLGYNIKRTTNLKKLIAVYQGRQNYVKMAPLYDQLIEIQSLTVDHYIKAALVNKEIGDYPKAREYVQKAMEIDESVRSQAEEFLKTLQ